MSAPVGDTDPAPGVADGADGADGEAAEPIDLTTEEAAAVTDVVESYLRAMPPERQAPYAALLTAVESGAVDGAGVTTLQQVCALALETGQARRIGLAEVETLVSGVYRRTPAGRARSSEVRDVNRALARLRGQELRTVRVAAPRPGRHTVTLGVPGFELTLAITAAGLEVSSLTTS